MGSLPSVAPKVAPEAVEGDIEPVAPVGAPNPNAVQPLEVPGGLGFEEEEIVADMSSKIALSLRCEELTKIIPTFVVVYCKPMHDEFWQELHRTEVCKKNTKKPVYDSECIVDFAVEAQVLLRFEVYRCRGENVLDDLRVHKFVGSAEAMLADVMLARSQASNGWLTRELMSPSQTEVGMDTAPGRIAVFAEEDPASKYYVSFNVVAKGIKSKNFWKRKADPYAIIHRTLSIPKSGNVGLDPDTEEGDQPDDLKCTPVYHTEVYRRTNCPRFKRVELSAATLCRNSNEQEILIELFDWFRVERHHYIGEVLTNLQELKRAWRTSKPIELPVCVREGQRAAGTGVAASRDYSKLTEFSLRNASNTKEKVAHNPSYRSEGSIASFSRFSSPNMVMDRAPDNNLDINPSSSPPGKLREKSATKESGQNWDFPPGKLREKSATKESGHTGTSSISRTTTGKDSQEKSESAERARIFGKVVGQLRLEDIGFERRYSFLDYIRGGLELRLAVAIDFTLSNSSPNDPDSSHCMTYQPSAYATVLRMVGDVISSYDPSKRFPVYGFGAKLPPSHTVCSDCFALSGDFFDPEVEGVDGMIQAYQRALQVARFHGPTHLAQVINLVAKLAEPYAEAAATNGTGSKKVDMRYYVMMILTDGAVDDQMETVNEILAAAHLPMSIVFVGIGSQDFPFLQELAVDVATHQHMLRKVPEAPKLSRKDSMASIVVPPPRRASDGKPDQVEQDIIRGPVRHLVNFVAYEDYRDDPGELTAATLSIVPREVVGYFTSKSVKPRGLDKMEDDTGNPIGKVVPSMGIGSRTKSDTSKSKAGGSFSPRGRTISMLSTNSKQQQRSSSNLLAVRPTKSGGSNSRSGTHLSAGDGNQNVPSKSPQELAKQRFEALPQFIKDEKARLMQEAEGLGYEKGIIKRAFRNGVPSNTLDALVDNIVHAGYGKSLSYKEAAEAIVQDMEVTLPGQPMVSPSRVVSRSLEKPLRTSTSEKPLWPSASSRSRSASISPSMSASRSPTRSRMNTMDNL